MTHHTNVALTLGVLHECTGVRPEHHHSFDGHPVDFFGVDGYHAFGVIQFTEHEPGKFVRFHLTALSHLERRWDEAGVLSPWLLYTTVFGPRSGRLAIRLPE